VTDSSKEWADEIMTFDQFLVEGFLVKPLRELAEGAGRKLDPSWGTLKVMQEVLVAKGLSGSEAKAIMEPMQRLHGLRTILKGHAALNKKRTAETEALEKHGSYRLHYTQLAEECDKAFDKVITAFGIDLEP